MRSVSSVVVARRATIEQRFGKMLYGGAMARFATLLVELADKFGVRDARGVIINLKLTHRELADMIGTSRETVSFSILDLKKQGLLVVEEKRIVLLDQAGLQALVPC